MASAASAEALEAATEAAPANVTLDTVIVTAERRGVDVQRTAAAITAVQAKSLDEGFITHITGLNSQVPSLQATKTAGFENLVTIRGVGSGTPENGLTTSPGVSQFIDGVYIANTIALDQTLFDIDRIEVLRGPQGALYGQSSIGGAINMVTKQPQLNRFDGYADVSVGTYELFRERAAVNIPVNDSVAIRASVQKFDREGFTKNVALAPLTLDDAHDASGKVAVLWKPRDNFSATLTAQLYKSNQHGDAQKNINDPLPDPREVFQDYPSHFSLESQLYHLNLQWDGPAFSLRSVSAYQGLDHVQQMSSSRSAFSLIGAYDNIAAWNTHVHNYTQEFDILSPEGSTFEWIVGAFALYQGSKQYVVEFGGNTQPTAEDLTIPPDVSTNPPSNLNYGNISHVLRRSFSAFAQGTYHVSDKLRVTGGVRLNHDYFKNNSYNFSAFGTSTVVNRSKGTTPTGRIEANYDVTPDNMVYASYARGYKPGGVNGNSGQAVILPTFKSEKNDAFEIGSKNYFFDRSLRLNVAAFYYNQKNFQYIQTDPVPFAAGISNIPKIRDYGVEFEAQYVGLDNHLRSGATLSLVKGEIVGSYKTIDSTVANAIINDPSFSSPCAFGGAFYNPACWDAVIAAARDIKGKTPPAMPKVSGTAYVSYRWDLPRGSITSKVQYTYRGSMWARVFNQPALDRVKSYSTTDLYFEYAPNDAKYRVSLTATNLFDKAGVNSRYTDPYGTGQTSQQFIPPRQVIGTITYTF
ncbi:TonB-dependent receptor [Phenylobacterium sp. LjRoot225]|uniref:TonB-dependent receptor n=1 Tax=Phenylobacterium sp. LjRoot225 TaxID=3342285 RepID=UPI003ECC3AC4